MPVGLSVVLLLCWSIIKFPKMAENYTNMLLSENLFNLYSLLFAYREGKEAPGNRGYKYFGAARDLPGVRELFETEVTSSGKKTRAELMRVSRTVRHKCTRTSYDEYRYVLICWLNRRN